MMLHIIIILCIIAVYLCHAVAQCFGPCQGISAAYTAMFSDIAALRERLHSKIAALAGKRKRDQDDDDAHTTETLQNGARSKQSVKKAKQDKKKDEKKSKQILANKTNSIDTNNQNTVVDSTIEVDERVVQRHARQEAKLQRRKEQEERERKRAELNYRQVQQVIETADDDITTTPIINTPLSHLIPITTSSALSSSTSVSHIGSYSLAGLKKLEPKPKSSTAHLLKEAKQFDEHITALKAVDEQKANELLTARSYTNAILRASGITVKDKAALLSHTLKKAKKKKEKSSKEWAERLKEQKKTQRQKQQLRTENIQSKIQKKKEQKLGKKHRSVAAIGSADANVKST